MRTHTRHRLLRGGSNSRELAPVVMLESLCLTKQGLEPFLVIINIFDRASPGGKSLEEIV